MPILFLKCILALCVWSGSALGAVSSLADDVRDEHKEEALRRCQQFFPKEHSVTEESDGRRPVWPSSDLVPSFFQGGRLVVGCLAAHWFVRNFFHCDVIANRGFLLLNVGYLTYSVYRAAQRALVPGREVFSREEENRLFAMAFALPVFLVSRAVGAVTGLDALLLYAGVTGSAAMLCTLMVCGVKKADMAERLLGIGHVLQVSTCAACLGSIADTVCSKVAGVPEAVHLCARLCTYVGVSAWTFLSCNARVQTL